MIWGKTRPDGILCEESLQSMRAVAFLLEYVSQSVPGQKGKDKTFCAKREVGCHRIVNKKQA